MWGQDDFEKSMKLDYPGRDAAYKERYRNAEKVGYEYLKRVGIWDKIGEWSSDMISTGTGWYNLAVLWDHIKTYKPRYFLECGAGVSTHVIAEAMERFCDYDDMRLVSMEHQPMYYEDVLKHRPKQTFVDIILSEVCLENIYTFLMSGYKDIPFLPYSMVFVDGPPQDTFIAGDLFWVISNAEEPVIGIIDSRALTSYVYYMILGPRFVSRLGHSTYKVGPITNKELDYRQLGADPWKRAEILERIGYIIESTLQAKNVIERKNDGSRDQEGSRVSSVGGVR